MLWLFESGNWNENNLNPLTRNNWRASLVPAAAVIPAPIAYIKVVAVKKLVVEPWVWLAGPPDPRFKDRKSTRLNSSHPSISYAVFCLKKKTKHKYQNYENV